MLCPGCGHENRANAAFCESCGTRLDSPVRESPRQGLSTSADFVGRQRELGELVSALDDALAGRGRLVMLVGEPGIGKTRTAQELVAIAEQRGAQVLLGRCYEGEGAPPYWPWLQPMRAYLAQTDTQKLRSQMGVGATDIAEILPEIRQKLPDLGTSTALEPAQARFRLFESIITFLKNIAGEQPTVLVLDNLHWADTPSLLLLEFLAAELENSPLLVLGTYRDVELTRGHPLARSLGELSRQRPFQRVLLRGLAHDDVGRYIAVALQAETAPELVEAIYEQSEGNPLFVGEMVHLLRQNKDEWDGRIPEGIREVIGRRLDRLSAECNKALTIASVIGREFDFEQLSKLVDRPSIDELLGELEEALGIGVIEEIPGTVSRYQFSHALIQRTLIEELSTTRRVMLHARIAETFEELYGADVESHAVELAYRFGEAQTVLGTEKLVGYSRLAGEQALAAYAWEDAQAHFRRALEAKEGESTASPTGQGQAKPAHDAEMAALLLGLGRVQSYTHHWEEAIETLARALNYFEDVGDVESAIMAGDCSFPPTAWPQFLPIVARVLKIIPPESLEAGRVLSRYGQCLAFVGDYEGSRHATSRALAIARREGDKFLEMWTLERVSFADRLFLRWDECLTSAMEAIQMASGVDNPMSECYVHLHAAIVFLYLGDLERARVHAANSLEPAERTHQVLRIVHALEINELVASAAGEWDVARGFSDRHLEMESLLSEGEQLSSRAMLEYQTGELAQFELYLKQLRECVNRGAPRAFIDRFWIAELARMSDTTADLEVVEAAVEEVLSSQSVAPHFVKAARVALALTALQEGNAALSAELYNSLLPFRGTLDYSCLISLDRLLALLVSATGRFDDAVAHFEDALTFCTKAGYRPELAWSYYDYAALRQAQGEREKALALLDEALTVSTELGMRPLLERAVALKERAEAQPIKDPIYPDGLTGREVEVLRLAATGRTDREIADELFISIRTASTHMRNILNKTDCSNRAEAATYANQVASGLLVDDIGLDLGHL